MLVQMVDLENNNLRLRWRIFGMPHTSLFFFCNVLTLIASASLKVAEVDLAAARNHIQQFKEISQASEEALASLNATHDEYKSTTEAQITASWVCLLRLVHIFMSTHLLSVGPTRNPSEHPEEHRTGTRANEDVPCRDETNVRECTGGMASGQEDSGGCHRRHVDC
jgi:hypothetical protein